MEVLIDWPLMARTIAIAVFLLWLQTIAHE